MPNVSNISPLSEQAARSPLRELLHLALPTIAQMASYTLMQFLDTWMLARLGVDEPTASGNAGLFAFSVIGMGFGVLLCVNTLVSQHFGQKDYRACGRYPWQGVWFGVGYSILALPTIPLARPMFTWFGHEPALVRLEATFFGISVAGTVVKLIGVSFGQFLLAVSRPGAVLLAALCGVSANAFSNWLLIYGNWGLPRLGLTGAALGTTIGITIEMLILARFFFDSEVRERFNTLDWQPRPRQLRRLLSIGIPSGVQLVSDVLAWGLFLVWVMARFGTAAMAANNFLFRYLAVSFMPAFGVATAVTALVGRYIGAGRPDIASRRAHLGFIVVALYMASCGAVYILGRTTLMKIFTDDPQVLQFGEVLLIFAGIYQLFDAMYIVYNGALRGAGDTLLPAIATAGLCWGVTVLGGYGVARALPQLGPAGPWLAATLYGIILGLFMLVRFARGRWKSINLEAGASSDKVPGLNLLPEQGTQPG